MRVEFKTVTYTVPDGGREPKPPTKDVVVRTAVNPSNDNQGFKGSQTERPQYKVDIVG